MNQTCSCFCASWVLFATFNRWGTSHKVYHKGTSPLVVLRGWPNIHVFGGIRVCILAKLVNPRLKSEYIPVLCTQYILFDIVATYIQSPVTQTRVSRQQVVVYEYVYALETSVSTRRQTYYRMEKYIGTVCCHARPLRRYTP